MDIIFEVVSDRILKIFNDMIHKLTIWKNGFQVTKPINGKMDFKS